MRDPLYFILDYETRSEAQLRTQSKKIGVGAWEYAVHPSTEILCAAWRIGTKKQIEKSKTKSWCPRIGHGSKKELLQYLRGEADRIGAHNAYFEQVITQHVLREKVPLEKWFCTAAQAATHALPRALEKACHVLELKHQKDKEGDLLIRRHCKPQKPTKKNPDVWNNDPEGLRRLTLYCERDVDAEVELFLTLPELSEKERRIWQINQKLNLRGIHVDRSTVKKVLRMMSEETVNLTREFQEKTGLRPSQRDAVKKYLNDVEMLPLANMQAKTIADILETKIPGTARRLLEIRQALSKTSTAKYTVFDLRSRSDSRVRDNLMYHGASTGREAGTGLQVHNFPQGTVRDLESLIEALSTGDLAWVRALFGNPMAAFSSALRGMIQATPGYRLFCGDFNAIEARVVFWLAGDRVGLRLFSSGVDPYVEMAAEIYSIPASEVTSAQRDVGKRAILGLGFGMGWKKFLLTCKQYGMPVTEALAKRAVQIYRERHTFVVMLWKNLERAAIAAVMNPGKAYTINRTKWFVKGKFLYVELPSGRRLAYFGPTIRWKHTPWGEKVPELWHWGVDSVSKKWINGSTYGGKLTENIVQATARDFMEEATIRLDDAGYETLIKVHDEILDEKKIGEGSLEEFERIMGELPPWGKGIPIKVKGWTGFRYKKG